MTRSSSACSPQITILNGSRHAVWVAIYKRSALRTTEPPVAWEVVVSPPRGKTTVFIPQDYQVLARYSFRPENPRRPVHQTNVLQVPHAPAGAGFLIEGVASPDRRIWGAVLTRVADSPGGYQVRMINRFTVGVWAHVKQGGRDIVSPRILSPLSAWTEDLDSPFYIAVLSLPRSAGDLLLSSEVALTEIAVKVGESVRVQGGPHKGFRISKISAEDSGVDKEPKAQANPKAKADTRKRAAVKKPTSRRRDHGATKKNSMDLL